MQKTASDLGELYQTRSPMTGSSEGVMACIDAIRSQQRKVDAVKNRIDREMGAFAAAQKVLAATQEEFQRA